MTIDTLLVIGCGKDGCKIWRAVAGSALQADVGADQIKPARGNHVVEEGALPLKVVVAGFAFGRESGGHVVHALGVIVIGLMAGDTLCIERCKGPVDIIGVTADAVELRMGAGQREAGLGVKGNTFDIFK